ncbi:dihydroorotase [Pseudoalteromonas carrageenovora]|uniref:dihydroorotase n=1 Tax=Pseudoalteromonas carrageenovora TaxID=227 RepID=UPI0026E3CC02|nr:dihydroorotase [Pseudoalteromonas carrageenovora]MDO6634926.1 dihydroorotase [Pseudoalteromonas carrageenovora]MDO6649503.1 dihydroorotase [Pseudoalteromonas carrageenovora]
MKSQLIKNAKMINEGKTQLADVRITNQFIERIASNITASENDDVIDANGAYLLPGMIDDQVHFREPGLTHKGSILTESRAAVAGGITSYMEMPNVNPSTTNKAALEEKYAIAEQHSYANYSFYLGATEHNLDDIKALDPKKVCGVKVFMGASTGNLLVENPEALEGIFRECPVLIVTHCEDGKVISKNNQRYEQQGIVPSITDHPKIRDAQACYASSSYAVSLAKKYNAQLHVLHITTAKELSLFTKGDITNKSITAEACVHHLYFSEQDYEALGNLIKCNPAIKAKTDRDALINAVKNNQIDIIATDHAPHTWQEKQTDYVNAPAGLPLVEHALLSLLEHVKNNRLSIEQVVEKTAHNPALRFKVDKRGFIKEGYYADLVLVSTQQTTKVSHNSCRYLCGWTPFDGVEFSSKIVSTWVNGERLYDGKTVSKPSKPAMPLVFNR